MKRKLLGLAAFLFCFNANAQNIRYATLTAKEIRVNTGKCNGTNGAYFNLYSASNQLLAGLNPYEYTLTEFYPEDDFGPRGFIPEHELRNYLGCNTTILLKIVNIYNPQIQYQGRITLQILKPVTSIHYYTQANGDGDYFYTSNYSTLGDGNAYGLPYQGVAFKAHIYPANRAVPVYRYFHPQVVNHYYTTTSLGSNTNGYVPEGIEFYAYTYQYTGTVPVYEYYSFTLRNHFYSTANYAPAYGSYRYRGIAFYAFPRTFGNSTSRMSGNEELIGKNSLVNTSSMSMFPNPASGVVTIKNDTKEINSVIVNDAAGKTLETKTINAKIAMLDLSNYPKGIYFLKVKTAEGEKVMKLVKE